MIVQLEDTMKEQTIAGRQIILEPGVKYIASRPMGYCMPYGDWPVTIRKQGSSETVCRITGLTYDEANEFLNALTWQGRVSLVWEAAIPLWRSMWKHVQPILPACRLRSISSVTPIGTNRPSYENRLTDDIHSGSLPRTFNGKADTSCPF